MFWGDYTPNSMNYQRPEYREENDREPKVSFAAAEERNRSAFPAAPADTYQQGENECEGV